jgi:hypothetical protein
VKSANPTANASISSELKWGPTDHTSSSSNSNSIAAPSLLRLQAAAADSAAVTGATEA